MDQLKPQTPRISIIIPSYNGEKYISETIESILKQSVLPDEIIISDDLSEDKTVDVIHKFQHSKKPEISVVHSNQSGISNNYLNALFHATGDIIIVGDQDDIWLQHKIETIINVFIHHPDVMLASSDSEVVDDNLNSLNTTLRGGKNLSLKYAKLASRGNFREFLIGLHFDAHTLAFRKEIIPLIKHQSFQKVESFWFENKAVVASLALGKFWYLPDQLTLYRQHSNQHTRKNIAKPNKSSSSRRNRTKELQLLLALLSDSKLAGRVISKNETHERVMLLTDYLQFIRDRTNITFDTSSLYHITRNLLKGRYANFTRRSLLSFSKDILQMIR